MTMYYIREKFMGQWRYVNMTEDGYDESDIPQPFDSMQVIAYLAESMNYDLDILADRIIIRKVEDE